MRAMLTCRDTQGRLRGLSPGAGSGSELAEPPPLPRGAPGWGRAPSPAPLGSRTPTQGCSPARPTAAFFCPPKRCVTCKGNRVGLSCGSAVSVLTPHRTQTRGHHWCRSCCSPLQFARAASALGISHSRGCSHRHLSMDLVLGCCSTSLEQLHAKEMASGSCQQRPPSSLHSHILAELTQSAGAAPHSPVYVGGLVESCVILLFAFPARRESREKQSGREQGYWD